MQPCNHATMPPHQNFEKHKKLYTKIFWCGGMLYRQLYFANKNSKAFYLQDGVRSSDVSLSDLKQLQFAVV